MTILFLKALQAGERWITVHPNGPDAKGQPVLIRENPDGSASVIGGAGGKLNFLRLRSVKSAADYAKDAKAKHAERREAAAEQRKKDKEAGTYEAKSKRLREVNDQVRKQEQKFIATVAEKLGWPEEAIKFDESKVENVSEAAAARLREQHHREVLKQAVEAVGLQRQAVIAEAQAKATGVDAGPSAEVPVVPTEDEPAGAGGLGFQPDYKARAEERGAGEAEVKAEASAVRDQSRDEDQRKAAIRRGETAAEVRKEAAAIRETTKPAVVEKKIADTKAAADLLRAEQELREVKKKARSASKEIRKSSVEPKAYVIEADADDRKVDEKVRASIENDLRTIQTRAFLSSAAEIGGDAHRERMARHIGVGSFNAVNALSLAATGDASVDRSVVDVLGVAGAARALAARLHADLSPEELDRVRSGFEDYHLHHYMRGSQDALNKARELREAAEAVKLGEADDGAGLSVAQEANSRRRDALAEAEKTIGTTLGELEGNAALVQALNDSPGSAFKTSLGRVPLESAITQLRAIGLNRGDYSIEEAGGNRLVTVTAEGLRRLAKPVNKADLEQIKRNLSIIRGDDDEDGWLPDGFSKRPDLGANVPAGVAPKLAEPMRYDGEQFDQALRDYIGGRTADGDPPADIVADMQSHDFLSKAGERRSELFDALNRVAPIADAAGKPLRAEQHAEAFEKMADEFVESRYGGARSTLNRQSVVADDVTADALHRAFAEHPEGVQAFKPVSDLTPQDQGALRNWFAKHVAKESPEAAADRAELERLQGSVPDQFTTDMFGEQTENPEYSSHQSRIAELRQKIDAQNLNWPKYVASMGSPERAYQAVQDLVKSRVNKAFADAHNRLRPDAPLKVGRAVIRHNLQHLDTVDPVAREARLQKQRELIDSLRERVQGRYASGSVREKIDAARDRREAFEQSQMGFFGAEEQPDEAAEVKPASDERYSLGHAAERQLAAMAGSIGRNFKPGESIKLFRPTMSGGHNAARQRSIKLIEANKRVGVHAGVGSGKTAIMLGGFSHLHSKGAIKRGLFLVPSIVQGQFGGEALRFLEPGKYNWHAQPGASREERIAAYKNPDTHFAVMTHQSFRDDMVHLAAQHAGISEEDVVARLDGMSPGERKQWMADTLKREGINFDYLAVDEAHNALNRAGKENSTMANVVDAMSANAPYYVSATGDPIKNDLSEMHSALQKMDPERYSDRDAFMRRYAADTQASRDELRREMARYFYPSKIDPDVEATRETHHVPLSEGQRSAVAKADALVARARLARIRGGVDLEALRELAPRAFEGVPEERHEEVGKRLSKSLGVLKESAIMRAINSAKDSAKVDEIARRAAAWRGRPGVVFARSRDAVENIRERLQREGHRVITITGSDSTKEKDRKKREFNPDSGEAGADIVVCSDAAAVGANLQRGNWLIQHDVPQTAMTHEQRNGRVLRTGQVNDVDLVTLVADHPVERSALKRMQDKMQLRELATAPLDAMDDDPDSLAYFLNRSASDQSQAGLF